MTLSLTAFKQKLLEGKLHPKTINSIKINLATKPTVKSLKKLAMLSEYEKGILKPDMKTQTTVPCPMPVVLEDTTNSEPATLSESDFDLLVSRKLNQLKQSADRRGKEFNLTFSVVKKLMQRKTCYYTGLKFDPNSDKLRRSIDRVDSTKGYVIGNVVACCIEVNQIKENLLENTDSMFKNNPKLIIKMFSKMR